MWLMVLAPGFTYCKWKRGQIRVFRHKLIVYLREIKRSESDIVFEKVIFRSEREWDTLEAKENIVSNNGQVWVETKYQGF